MSEGNNRKKRPRKRKGSNKPKRHGGAPKADLKQRFAKYDSDARSMAQSRFELEPRPIAIPEELEEPRSFSFEWTNRPVSLKTESVLAGQVVRKGEFGWLTDERVSEIAVMVEELDMTLDQALSLRSALLQQKTVYTHGKLQSRSDC